METGKIIQLLERDFGFIKRSGYKDHLYFHADDLTGLRFSDLSEGDPVEFAITESRKGPYAIRVSRHIR